MQSITKDRESQRKSETIMRSRVSEKVDFFFFFFFSPTNGVNVKTGLYSEWTE